MIFNKANKGSEELKQLVGSYYASNSFTKVQSDIDLAAAELVKIIGNAVYAIAEAAYHAPEHVHKELVPYVQLPIAILATFNMYRQNDVSHEDSGRKIKIDATNEKLPWEWQLKRDDEIQLDRYYQAVDRLIAYLDSKADFAEWQNSAQKAQANHLFIKNADMFDMYFPINKSGRMYMMLLPWIREAERKYIQPALGADYAKYLAGTDLSESEKETLALVYPAIPLFAMSIAVKRMPLGLIPAGVVRNYVSRTETMNASDPASMTDVHYISKMLFNDALDLLDDMKKLRNSTVRILIPENDPKNKYMRV